MKRFILLLVAIVICGSVSYADNNPNHYYKSGNDRFSIKVSPFMGYYMAPHGNLRDINPNGPTGVHIGIEFPSSQQRPWQQYLNNPTTGLGISYIDLGHKAMGTGIAMYPYILINCVRSEHFNLKFKVGAGLVALNQHFYTTQDEPIPNRTFSTTINAYLTPGLNAEFPITRNLTLNGEFGFFHISNGRSVEPNKGANVPYGSVGFIATFNPPAEEERAPIHFPDLPYKWSLNVTAGAGIHAADEDDPHRFMVSTFHLGAIYSTCNWHGIGLGADLFYNDAIGNPDTGRGMYVTTEDDWRRMRGGISIDNEFKFGNVTAMVNWGVYLFNPVRNLYDNDSPFYGRGPRPLFYKSEETGVEERFHYIQFGAKVRVVDNVFLQAIVKTHMHIAEFIEFGVCYQIPYLNKSKRSNGKSIFHHTPNWWEEYE